MLLLDLDSFKDPKGGVSGKIKDLQTSLSLFSFDSFPFLFFFSDACLSSLASVHFVKDPRRGREKKENKKRTHQCISDSFTRDLLSFFGLEPVLFLSIPSLLLMKSLHRLQETLVLSLPQTIHSSLAARLQQKTSSRPRRVEQ